MCLLLAVSGLLPAINAAAEDPRGKRALAVVVRGTEESELAPHGKGNVYAPDILIENGTYRMWYGGQGEDGHDRIHYAESRDGLRWEKKVSCWRTKRPTM